MINFAKNLPTVVIGLVVQPLKNAGSYIAGKISAGINWLTARIGKASPRQPSLSSSLSSDENPINSQAEIKPDPAPRRLKPEIHETPGITPTDISDEFHDALEDIVEQQKNNPPSLKTTDSQAEQKPSRTPEEILQSVQKFGEYIVR